MLSAGRDNGCVVSKRRVWVSAYEITQPQLGAADNERMSDPKEHQHKSPSATAPQQTSPQPDQTPVAAPTPEQVNRMLTNRPASVRR